MELLLMIWLLVGNINADEDGWYDGVLVMLSTG